MLLGRVHMVARDCYTCLTQAGLRMKKQTCRQVGKAHSKLLSVGGRFDPAILMLVMRHATWGSLTIWPSNPSLQPPAPKRRRIPLLAKSLLSHPLVFFSYLCLRCSVDATVAQFQRRLTYSVQFWRSFNVVLPSISIPKTQPTNENIQL